MMIEEMVKVAFTINGREVTVASPGQATALHLLRNVLGLKGTKEGCGIGECGACTIVVDGKAVNSCIMPAARLDGTEVISVEGLARGAGLHPLQEKFIEHHAVQCGFCTPGLLMSTYALLEENNNPGSEEISKAIAGNLCRCTGYQQIITSIEAAVDSGREGEDKR
jgi:carbon-monoxide dehydrogenase small subunit